MNLRELEWPDPGEICSTEELVHLFFQKVVTPRAAEVMLKAGEVSLDLSPNYGIRLVALEDEGGPRATLQACRRGFSFSPATAGRLRFLFEIAIKVKGYEWEEEHLPGDWLRRFSVRRPTLSVDLSPELLLASFSAGEIEAIIQDTLGSLEEFKERLARQARTQRRLSQKLGEFSLEELSA